MVMMMMVESSCEFHALDSGHQGAGLGERRGEEEEEEEGGCGQRCGDSCRRVLTTLTIPLTDCRRRSHPRIVPDYSVLVLVACVTNPVLGALVCYLHRRAKNLSHKGQLHKADVWYMVTLGLAVVSVGSSLLCVSLLTLGHVVGHFSQENIRWSKPATDCLFRHEDFVEMKRLNLSRNDYCRRWLALHDQGEARG